jgi:probable F420-dependent oxidoreductase
MADQLGYDSVWVSDHVVVPSRLSVKPPAGARGRTFTPDASELFYEAIVLLSALASTTTKVTLGTSVLIVPQRNPVVLAKQLSTLDALSHGRLHIGVGAGWLVDEYQALQAPFAGRWDRLEEYIRLFRRVWTDHEAQFTGPTYSFAPIRMAPKPAKLGGPPITVGGRSTRALKVAGTLTQGLHAARLTPAEVTDALGVIQRYAIASGRSRSDVSVLMRADLRAVGKGAEDSGPWEFGGSADEVATAVRGYQTHGVSELILTVANGEPADVQDGTIRWFSENVLPLVN